MEGREFLGGGGGGRSLIQIIPLSKDLNLTTLIGVQNKYVLVFKMPNDGKKCISGIFPKRDNV